jgi:AraC-like DNA-binding protein
MNKPLDRFPAIRTRDPAEMRHILARLYQASDIAFPEGADGFFGYTNHVDLRQVSLSFGSCRIPVDLQHDGIECVRQQLCLDGTGRTTVGDRTFILSAGVSCITPAEVPATFSFDHGFEHLVLRIPQVTLERKLAALLGTAAHPNLVFEPDVDMETANARHLRSMIKFLVGSLDENGLDISPPALDELEQMLAVTFLFGTHHSARHLLESETAAVAPWQVRRVEDFIEANWSQPVTVETLAEATGASARSIFKTFADHRGYSPMEFLRKVRLREARNMLHNPNAATTVTAVGLACGFVNLGHFARYYQASFGELPSETLARTKGRT